MKRIILLLSLFCLISLVGTTVSQNNESTTAPMTVLRQDSGTNLSLMDMRMYSAAGFWGIDAYSVGQAVKFTAPNPGWQLKQIRVAGWNGFDGNTTSIPESDNFLIEVRDAKYNLLYRMADTQNAYFTYPYIILRGIDIPPVSVSDDFYIIFYDRGTMVTGMEMVNATGNSYFYNSLLSEMLPVEITDENNVTTKINWIIRAVGE